jgi:hypothetical protein
MPRKTLRQAAFAFGIEVTDPELSARIAALCKRTQVLRRVGVIIALERHHSLIECFNFRDASQLIASGSEDNFTDHLTHSLKRLDRAFVGRSIFLQGGQFRVQCALRSEFVVPFTSFEFRFIKFFLQKIVVEVHALTIDRGDVWKVRILEQQRQPAVAVASAFDVCCYIFFSLFLAERERLGDFGSYLKIIGHLMLGESDSPQCLGTVKLAQSRNELCDDCVLCRGRRRRSQKTGEEKCAIEHGVTAFPASIRLLVSSLRQAAPES